MVQCTVVAVTTAVSAGWRHRHQYRAAASSQTVAELTTLLHPAEIVTLTQCHVSTPATRLLNI